MVVTGSSGYIGKRLVLLATGRGWNVVRASRCEPTSPDANWFYFDLASSDPILLPEGTNVVVHLAANTAASRLLSDADEMAAAQRLIKSAQSAGARLVFVSSQTARHDAPTSYGRVKWHIEQYVLEANGLVVRPGQVYGGRLLGLYGTLVKVVQKVPLLPLFMPGPKIQPIHVDDLAEGLLRIAERRDMKVGVYCLAAAVPISFSEFLGGIAKSRLRCQRIFFPVPVLAINALMAFMGATWRERLGLDRLRSLFDLPAMTTAPDLHQLGLALRSLQAGLHPSGCDRRRRLLREGRALLVYISRKQPGSAVMRRYVRAIEGLCGGREFGLPGAFLRFPILLSLLGRTSWSEPSTRDDFVWRLDTATLLAEASIAGAGCVVASGRARGLLRSVLSITRALAGEAFWRLARLVFSPLCRWSIASQRAQHES